MLRTKNGHEVTGFSLHDNDVKMWRAVSLEFRIPYFLICHSCQDNHVWIDETCLLWRQTDVVDFCKDVSQDAERKILKILMLLPVDGTERWKMVEVKEVWSDAGCEKIHPAVFIASDGTQLGPASSRQSSASSKASQKLTRNWPPTTAPHQ